MRGVLRRIFDAVFPAQCAVCSAVGSGLCERCLPSGGSLERALPTLRVCGLGTYDGALRAAVLAVKDGRRDVARTLGERVRLLDDPGGRWVPIPTSRARLRVRGIDGVRSIAERAVGERVLAALRLAGNDAQRGRSRSERIGAHGRFQCLESVAGLHLTLFDDVCTTGSTLEDCARALRIGGATVSAAVVIALA